MNPKIMLGLTLAVSGFWLGCSGALVHPVNEPPDSIYRIVVEPAKSQARVRCSFSVKLLVENVTATNLFVHTMSQSWQSQWQTSNPDVSLCYPAATANAPITIAIPPGGIWTNEMGLGIVKSNSNDQIPFQMGFTPDPIGETFWSKEVSVRVIP